MFEGLKRELGVVIARLDEASARLDVFEERQAQVLARTTATGESLRREIDGLEESANQVSRGVERSLADVRSRAVETKQAVEKELHDIKAQAEETRDDTASALDDLIDRLSEARNEWDAEIQLGLEALQAGAISFEEFLRRYGDLVIEVEGQTKRIRDVLAGTEREIEDRLQDLFQKIRDRATSLEEIITEVQALGGRFAESVAEMIRKFQEGQISFEELARRLQQLQNQFPNSDLDELIDDLLDRLQQEERDGLI